MYILRRLNSGQPAIGEWVFSLNTSDSETSSSRQVERFAHFFHVVIPVLEILHNSELFYVEEIVVDDFRDYDLSPPDCWVRNQNLIIPCSDLFSELAYNTKSAILKKYSKFLFPEGITFRGSSILVMENGVKQSYKGVLSVICSPDDFLTIVTDCDAWLPFDLKGTPQKVLSDLNAPRLVKALEEIENKLGSRAEYENTDYAIVNHFSLSNYLYPDGTPATPSLDNRIIDYP